MASLAAGLLLAAPDARAGSYSGPMYSGGSVTSNSSGHPYILLYPFSTSTGTDSVTGNPGYGANGYASCGTTQGQSTSFSIEINSTPSLTATFTWKPGYAGEPVPACVVVVEHCMTSWTGYQNGTGTASGNTYSTLGPATSSGPLSETYDNTKYTVEVPSRNDGTVTLTCSPIAGLSASSGTSGGGSGGISVSYSVGIVSGGWDGPYYFHNGEKDDGVNDTPWANNTVGATPSITDVSDSVCSFLCHNPAGGQAYVKGSITPVWYWNGPDLGVPPPPFEVTVNVSASANNNSGDATGAFALDGIDDNPHNIGSSGKSDLGSEDVAVQVQSDEYAPGEGNGYWAIGPTVDLYASVFGNSPSDLESWVSLDASIESGLNN